MNANPSSSRSPDPLPVAVLGAGPVGLAAAANLIERKIPFFILEAGKAVGANLTAYGHVRLFSPWQYNVDHAVARLLQATGWQAPALSVLPLASEVVDQVLAPFARLPQVAAALHLDTRVVSINREAFDKVKSLNREASPFLIRAVQDGRPVEFRARAVIDATGTWTTPNPLGADGSLATGEADAREQIFYGIPDILGRDRLRYAGKRTLVVGAGHSAANALLALAQLRDLSPSTQLVWGVRSQSLARVFGAESDALPARGQLGVGLRKLRDTGGLQFASGLRIAEVSRENGKLRVVGAKDGCRTVVLEDVDEIICATGQRPDLSTTSELRLKLDVALESTEALGPLIDPNAHSCGTVRPHGHRELAHPEQGFYTAGVKSYGRAPTFLMTTGFEQVRSVVAALAGDLESADRVELELPETGVCSVGDAGDAGSSACCAAPKESDAVPLAAISCAASSCVVSTPAAHQEVASH